MGGTGTTTGYQSNGSGPYVAAPYAPSTQDISGTSHLGQWIQLQIPNPVKLTRAVIGSDSANYQHGQFVILGSNDNTNWTPLHAGTQDTLNSPSTNYSGGTNVTTLSAGSLEYFIYFRVVIKSKYNSGSNNVRLDNIQFFGVAQGANADSWVVSNQPYKVKVNSTSGLIGTSTAAIGFAVGWTSPAAGATLSFNIAVTTTHTLVGIDGGGGTNRKFTVVSTGVNDLPSGLNLTESGVISGIIVADQDGVTTTVTFRLTDIGSGLFTDRAINIVGSVDLYTMASPFTFTNAGVTGQNGPTLSDLTTGSDAYSPDWTDSTNNLNVTTRGIQEWTVPVTGTYQIEVAGAGASSTTQTTSAGHGYIVRADISLTMSQIVKIVVGQCGTASTQHASYSYASGGGGASWVYIEGSSLPILVGGGGGGGAQNLTTISHGVGYNSGYSNYSYRGSAAAGQRQTSIGAGGQPGVFPLYSSTGLASGAGGAGWLSDGGESTSNRQGNYNGRGKTKSNGFIGGTTSEIHNADGGFGGGGAATDSSGAGGGGGGYTGGPGGDDYNPWGGGGGGSSYLSGTNQQEIGIQSTAQLHGYVKITKL